MEVTTKNSPEDENLEGGMQKAKNKKYSGSHLEKRS